MSRHLLISSLLLLLCIEAGATAKPFDFDGDGKADISVYHRDLGNWYIRNSATLTTLFRNFGWSQTVPVPGDYDGDGKIDIAVFHRPTANWYILQSLTGTIRIKQFGWFETTPVAADYDGDGKTDIAVFRRNTGDWYILQSLTGTLRIQNWGTSATRPVPADYDGDNKDDIAVFNPSTATWSILQSSNGSLRTQIFGNSESKPVYGDFDGDGKDDIAVYLPTTGNWLIFQSSTGTTRVQNWGWSLAGAVPADYDGDGKTDIAVYYPESGTWYILQSSNSMLFQMNFGWMDARAVPAYAGGSVEGLRVLCLGDSITFGRGSSLNDPRTGYPILTERRLDAEYGGDFLSINVGDPGETTSGGRNRLSSELNRYLPDVLCLMEGTNDEFGFNPTPFSTTESNLRAMVNTAKSRGVFVVIATIPPVDPSSRPDQYSRIKAFNPRIYSIASSLGIPVARVYEYITAVPNWDDLLIDPGSGNHPNDAGYQRVRDAFFDALAASLNSGLIY